MPTAELDIPIKLPKKTDFLYTNNAKISKTCICNCYIQIILNKKITVRPIETKKPDILSFFKCLFLNSRFQLVRSSVEYVEI